MRLPTEPIAPPSVFGEKRKLERLHAVIFNPQFCSVLSACAAY